MCAYIYKRFNSNKLKYQIKHQWQLVFNWQNYLPFFFCLMSEQQCHNIFLPLVTLCMILHHCSNVKNMKFNSLNNLNTKAVT